MPGIFPRSEAVVSATRGLDRGRTGADVVEQAFRQDLQDFVRLQQTAGLDFFSDGLLRWHDIFRPFLDASNALKPGALVRWFDNNAFFRAPIVNGRLGPAALPASQVPDDEVPRPRVATLPSPYTFSRAAQTTADRNQLMVDLARHVLRPAADAMAGAGCQIVHLQEPWLAFYGIDPGDWDPFERALASLHEGLDATLVLHLYFGDAGPHLSRIRRLPIDAVGIDFVATDIVALGKAWPLGLVAGCLDGRRSVVESLEGTVELARRLTDAVSPDRLSLMPTCDLEFLPRDVARKKVVRLGEAARRIRELVRA